MSDGPMRFAGVDELRARIGEEIGVTAWRDVRQEDVTAFGELTGDTYWLHTDPERAAAEGPYGGTIAHGFYTLSLAAGFAYTLWEFTNLEYMVNYGLDRLRFTAPVLVGGKVRMRAKVLDVADAEGGARYTMLLTFEQQGDEKPVLIAEWVGRVWFSATA